MLFPKVVEFLRISVFPSPTRADLPALVLHMSMHYHSPLATILGPVHDSNDH